MPNFLQNAYLTDRFFWCMGSLIVLFGLGFAFPVLFLLAKIIFFLFLAILIYDWWQLFRPVIQVKCQRKMSPQFYLGDPNQVILFLKNQSNLPLSVSILEEIPFQFQLRDFKFFRPLATGEELEITYELTPVTRGIYKFGYTNCFLSSRIGLLERRIRGSQPEEVAVYPSVLQMKQMELRAFANLAIQRGTKKIRRLGHSYEFEQIKNYVRGDDYRSINWKASSRRNSLMVNQYEDERSQQVYLVIDKSRNMKMPFDGLSLVDYAINASLAMSNVILRKYDKAGLITFSDKIGSVVKADSKPAQLNKILETLYADRTVNTEADYELLYYASRKLIPQRSLLVLFTNFESIISMNRVLPILRRINKFHLLVVVIFENTEIAQLGQQEVRDLQGIYTQTIGQTFRQEKEQMIYSFRQFGIQTVLTQPADLSINTINKYLELKSRGLI